MRLVEQHVIRDADPRYAAIDRAAFASKNLYNAANYIVRQSFIHVGVYLNFAAVFHLLKDHEASCALPRKVSNDVLRQLDRDWRAFFAALAAWKADPSMFVGRPRLPRYKDKQKGRSLLIYDIQAISLTGLQRGEVIPSQFGISIRTKQTTVQQARIVPRKGYYVVNGRPVKSINQCYNKRRAELQQKLGTLGTLGTPGTTSTTGTLSTTRQLERLTAHRTRQIDHYLHTASRRIIDLLVTEGIGTLVIGKNPLWKQHARMGKRNNQNFVQVPHARFIEMLAYQLRFVGIHVQITEESYTSTASFLDADPLPVYGDEHIPAFSGKRVKRGLYRAADGRHINADVNGSYNIIRKVLPDAFGKGIAGAAVHPVRFPVRTKRVA